MPMVQKAINVPKSQHDSYVQNTFRKIQYHLTTNFLRSNQMMILRNTMSFCQSFTRRNHSLHFPDAKAIKTNLCTHPFLNMPYYQEKGVTKAISELAAERFANQTIVPLAIEMGSNQIIMDLLAGEDGFTGKPLPNLGKLGLDNKVWTQLLMSTEAALLECAKTHKE